MILTLSIHHSRAWDLLCPDPLVTSPAVPVSAYRDLSSSGCSRFVAPAGTLLLLSSDALVRDSGLPKVVAPAAVDYALGFDRRNARGSSPTRLHAILTALLK